MNKELINLLQVVIILERKEGVRFALETEIHKDPPEPDHEFNILEDIADYLEGMDAKNPAELQAYNYLRSII